jgi:molybdopterin biosynthesis enzyme
MDFLNRAMEQAKALQQMTAEAMQKSVEQATPMVKEAVTKAQELQKTLIDQAPSVTAAAQEQYNAALQHAGAMIATGKTVLEAGSAQAQQHLAILADQAKKAADATRGAVHSATAPPQAETPVAPPPPPYGTTGST